MTIPTLLIAATLSQGCPRHPELKVCPPPVHHSKLRVVVLSLVSGLALGLAIKAGQPRPFGRHP